MCIPHESCSALFKDSELLLRQLQGEMDRLRAGPQPRDIFFLMKSEHAR